MKVGIDASRAFLEGRTGTEEYAYQLIKNLTKIDTAFCQFFLYVREGSGITIDLPDNFSIIYIKGEKLWTQARLSWELWKNPVDVLFIPSHTVPFIHPKKTIVMIHGLEFRACCGCYSLKERAILEINTFISILLAGKIIVPSENTKKDLIRFYNVKSEKIKVVNHGTESQKFIKPKVHKVKSNEFNILFIGRLEKRKNILNLIKAFEVLNSKFKIQNSEFKLTLAGKAGFGFDEIKRRAERSEYGKDIIFTGYVPENKKDDLYDKADVFVFPSFYEGFGMPVLEAMSRGVPVICSDASSLPEVAGDSALMIDPNNAEDMADGLMKVFGDDEFRAGMIGRGFENIKKFSWEECAKETLDILLNA